MSANGNGDVGSILNSHCEEERKCYLNGTLYGTIIIIIAQKSPISILMTF